MVVMRGFALWAFVLAAISQRGQEPTATLEPDHFYIYVSADAPERAAFRDLGIDYSALEPRGGGQQITFFFENIFIELMWVADEQVWRDVRESGDSLYYAVQHARVNWRSTGASPFGLAFHRVGADTLPLPFELTRYWGEDRLGGIVFSDPRIPAILVQAPRVAMPNPAWMTPELRALSTNRAGINRLTGVTLGSPHPLEDDVLEVLADQGAISLRAAGEHVLELTFDNGRQGRTHDFRPDLPLVFHY